MKTLKEQFEKKLALELEKELEIDNAHRIPRPSKVVVNVGLGRMSQRGDFDKLLNAIEKEFAVITGQKPSARPAKKSISGFKLREGQTIGLAVTLRGTRMFEFIDKLVKIVFPRLRDFKGIDLKNVDKQGTLNIGFRDNFVFPEVNQDTSAAEFGLQITIVPTTRNRQWAVALYKKLGFLFKK